SVVRLFGVSLRLYYVGGRLLVPVAKLSTCVYRPWVRDARVHPAAAALETATGYSFPSGHTQSAAAIYGSVGLWYGRKRRWLAVLMVVMILLTAFSRNYLGVHTPQDVLAGMALTGGYLWLNGKVAARLERQPNFDKTVAAVGMAAASRRWSGSPARATRWTMWTARCWWSSKRLWRRASWPLGWSLGFTPAG